MSFKTSGGRQEPVRTRKSSRKDTLKTASQTIPTAFKMAADKKGKEKEKGQSSSQESNVELSETIVHDSNDNISDSAVPQAEGRELNWEVKDVSIQVNAGDIALKCGAHDKSLNADVGLFQLEEAVTELTEKYDKLDDVMNNPKKGFGTSLVGLTLRSDGLYTDIHGAVNGILTRLSKLEETTAAHTITMEQHEATQKRLTSMLAENKRLSRDLVVAQGLLQKYSQKIKVLEDKILDVSRRGMEQNLILHAVEEPQNPKEENCHATVKEFIKQFLKIDLDERDIWKAYRMGMHRANRARPLFVKLLCSTRQNHGKC